MKRSMDRFKLNPLARAIALATATAPVAAYAQGQEHDAPVLEEVIVTATKREVNMQDVAQSVQAFNTDQIAKLGLANMADLLRAIPSMSTVTTSPGRNEVVFRGVSTGSGEWRTDSGSAVYLGDVPMTSATQSVDPRNVDIERVEALPGPQGTLFGSSSQSGALRIIPNRPDYSGTYGAVDVGATYMEEGDPGHKVEGWINIPIVDNRFAVRGALFDVKTGGFIDNIYGTNIFSDDDNADVVEDNFNEWKQSGGRISALWSFAEGWDAELMYMQQKQKSEGDWKSDPNAEGVDDLEIVRFHKDEREDDWWISSLTVTGDVGFAEFKSITSYLDREITYEFDANVDGQIRAERVRTPGEYIYYNVWYDTGFNPETSVNDQTAERVTQELRLASYGDSRLQWMLGAFYEKTDDAWEYSFARVENLSETPFGQYWDLGNYIPDTDDWYAEDYKATTEQVAVFGEMNYQFTDSLSATVGARWFEYDRDRREFKSWPEGNPYDTDIYEGTDDDTLFKFAVNYDLSDDKMIYALYSEGYRLGGYNSIKNPSSRLPDTYDPDKLTNYEMGLKSEWLDNSLQWNLSAYLMEWEGIQRGITDPDDWTANGTVNMGDADIMGIETTLAYQITNNLRVDASYAWSDSELQDDYWASDTIDLSDPSQDWQLGADGQELAIAPPSKWWIGVEYNMPGLIGYMDGWVRYDHSWRDEMYHDWWNAMNAETGYGGRKLLEEIDEGSLQLGLVAEGNWSVTLSVWNIWDDRNAQWIDSGYDGRFGPTGTWPEVGRYVNMPGYNRPREFELTFRKDFSF
jgi:iron complex outermembrane recepter protein